MMMMKGKEIILLMGLNIKKVFLMESRVSSFGVLSYTLSVPRG